MRRLVSALALLGLLATFVVVGQGSGDSSDGYKVRAIFRNAFSVIPGEDVKIAGVKVGKISHIDVTPQQTAAVTLEITEPGFQDFRRDAECTIRPQSLIGEKFVECTPTQPRPDGAQKPPPLRKIEKGDGEGEYLLPVTNTSRPVDIDLVNNILRLPYRQRLSLLLNEFGGALAGRGEDLRSVNRNADPALKQTDRVLAILAKQNRVLADLARDSDAVMAPLAGKRDKVADFITQANAVSKATASRSADLERSLQRLPEFLRQLRPTMAKLGALSDQATPVLSDLGSQAPQLNRFISQLGPFSKASIPALTTLGQATVPGREALLKAKPIAADLKSFAAQAKPLTTNLRAFLTSLKSTGGVERLLDYVFYQVAAVNGFDAYGHYLRAQLVVNLCSTYATTPDPACSANFVKSGSTRSARAALASSKDGERDPALARMDAVLRGMSPEEVLGKATSTKARLDRTGGTPAGEAPLALPPALLPSADPAPSTATPTPGAAPQPGTPQSDAVKGLLDYLLGGGA
jgi:ABC-type transporter Mla subunit MlaD